VATGAIYPQVTIPKRFRDFDKAKPIGKGLIKVDGTFA